MSEKQSLNKISEDLISIAAMNAVLSVSGVNHLTDSLADNITKKIVGKNENTKGINRNCKSFIIPKLRDNHY